VTLDNSALANSINSLEPYSSSQATFEAPPPDTRIKSPFADYETSYGECNWDGFGALAITCEVIETASQFFNFLSPWLRSGANPSIAPGSDGTIGFEWRSRIGPIRKIFVEVQPSQNVRAYWVDATGNISRLPVRKLNFASYKIQDALNVFVGKA
jgi:hypothetical protein